MKILICSATLFESKPLINFFEFNKISNIFYEKIIGSNHYFILISGIGLVATTYNLSKYLFNNNFDLAINIGICGSFNSNFEIGTVLNIIEEEFADFGINDNGIFKTCFDENFISENEFPFTTKKLKNDFNYTKLLTNIDLQQVKSITVNTASGEKNQISILKQKFNAEIENMEGGAFFYVCLSEKIPFLQIRSISNYVEPRNKNNWKIKLAIENLNNELIKIIKN